MKVISYEAPFYVRENGLTVEDSNGVKVTKFRDEEMAEDYCRSLNVKHLESKKNDDAIVQVLGMAENLDCEMQFEITVDAKSLLQEVMKNLILKSKQ